MKTNNKFTFTKKRLGNLPDPNQGNRDTYFDEKTPGLILYVSATAKSFQVRKKFKGKSIRVTLGKYPEITIDQARKLAQRKLTELSEGINPNQQKREGKIRSVTLRECFEKYLETKKLKPLTKKDYRNVMDTIFHDWMDIPLKKITKDMVSTRHRKRGDKFETGARNNNAMRVLRAIFNFAAEEYENAEGESLFPINPVTKLSKQKTWYNIKRRETVIRDKQINPWFSEVKKIKNPVIRDYLFLLMFTGLRREEAASLTWTAVDLEEKTLTVKDTKNSETLVLPLSDYVFKLLSNRKEESMEDSEFVFPSKKSRSGYLCNPYKQIAKVKEGSKVEFMIHDLRRTFITIAEGLDLSVYVIKRLVNHSMKADVTDGYIISDVERLRQPMQQIANHILIEAGEINKSEIIYIDDRRKVNG